MKKYTLNSPQATKNSRDLHLAFDVGHSSIGWAVLQTPAADLPQLLGCGAVIFQADDCLASQRRGFRRQRRHIRATRLRIARMKSLLAHLGVLTPTQLDHVSTSSPWFHAARVLASDGQEKLTWPQLWDVLRWYAHNRGYDGNKAWSRHEQDAAAEKEDTEKVETARNLLTTFKEKHHRPGSMAEVWCDLSGLDPLGPKSSTHLPDKKSRPKAQNAAFPREQVVREVKAILEAHIATLTSVDETCVSALLSDWTAIPCDQIRLPARYCGGLLFGQLVPRFDNRIVATCPISFERHYQRLLADTGDESAARRQAEKLSKVPSAHCPDFYRYRWAMQLANIQIVSASGLRRLTSAERHTLHQQIQTRGYFTKGELKKAVRALTGGASDNLDQMLLHPDAEKALILDPVQRLINSGDYSSVFATLPDNLLKRLRGQLRRGTRLSLTTIRGWLGGATAALDSALAVHLDTATTRRRKNTKPLSHDGLLATILQVEPASGRAPHTRALMAEVFDFVLSTDRHPAEEGGPLYRSEAIRSAQLQRAIDDQTNNHLVRHRLRILDRLHHDLIASYAAENRDRIGKITIEVNRDLRELSGKTTQEVAKDQNQRLYNFKSVVKKLEAAFEGKNIKIGPGLIRKARIAEDLGWTCPYTGKAYDAFDLHHRRVDLDHIIPRSLRPSDSLDSLAVTFSEVNKMKGKRTAVQFIEEFQSHPVPGLPQVHIKPLTQFAKDVDALESFKGHDDDKRRKKNRKRLLQLHDYVEKEFTPGDLTKTSQLVRLGAQILQKNYLSAAHPPVITSLPGAVTGSIRKSWRLLGCLSAANPAIAEETTKTEVRSITHLHHAVDASVLAFGSHFLPRDGGVWELLIKRKLAEGEQKQLLSLGTLFHRDASGRVNLADLPGTLKTQIRQCLTERRVVQHMPSDLSGLSSKETVWRVFDPTDNHPNSQRLARWLAQANITAPKPDAATALIICRKRRSASEEDGSTGGKTLRQTKTWQWVYDIKDKSALLGFAPEGDLANAKLKKIKAVKVLGDNFGLALDPEPTIIRPHKIWHQLKALREANSGKPVRIIRKGTLIQVPLDAPSKQYRGMWMIRGTTLNQRDGFLVDMSPPDKILYRKQPGCFQNVKLATLLKCKMEVLTIPLSGADTATKAKSPI